MLKKIPPLFVLLSVLCLPGCMVPVIIAGAAAGGMLLNDQRDVKTILADKKIQQKILSRFTNDPILRQKTHLTLSVLNGTVLAAGQALNANVRHRALKIIQSVPHRRTYDQIEIMPLTSVQQRAEDTLITAKIKTAMLTYQGLRSMQIKIVTENNVVYLMGIVTQKQGHMAAEVARKVQGVRKVVKLFETLKHKS